MSIAFRLRGAALVLGLLAPLAAGAQPAAAPSAEGAQWVAASVREWLGRQLGGIVDVAVLPPLRVTAEGEAYRLEVPVGGAWFGGIVTVGEGAVALTVKPLDGGRWEVLGGGLPHRLEVEMKDPSGAPGRMRMSISNRETTGVFDPSLASASQFVSVVSGYATETTTATGVQASRIGKLVDRSEWSPSGPGRVTIQSDSRMEDYATVAPLPVGGEVAVKIGRLGGATRIENFDVDGLGAMLRTAFALGLSAREGAAGGSGGANPAQDKATMMKLAGQVFALLDALETDYEYEDIAVDGGLFSFSLRRTGMGFSVGAPDGKVDIRLRLAAEGLDSPMIPPGPWVEFIPHRAELTPRVGGMPKEAAMALLRHAIESDGKDMQAHAEALLAAHPLTLGIDDLLVDLGPLRLKGAGRLEVARIDAAEGTAELRATGLDALIRRANAVPDLKVAAPVLIFLKGIGRQEGSETVWTISYEDGKVMVNDTDLSDMIPSR